MEKWALILIIKLQLTILTLAGEEAPSSLWRNESDDMMSLLRGDKTMAEFVQDYPEYQEGGSPDGGD